GDGAAVAEESDKDGEADGRLGRGNGEHEDGEDLAHQIVEEGRKGNEVDVDREQDQFDRHQDDDDVLAVEEDAEDADGEQNGGNREIMAEPHGHGTSSRPWPERTCLISMAVALVRAFCRAMLWRLTRSRWCSVGTMAPTSA